MKKYYTNQAYSYMHHRLKDRSLEISVVSLNPDLHNLHVPPIYSVLKASALNENSTQLNILKGALPSSPLVFFFLFDASPWRPPAELR